MFECERMNKDDEIYGNNNDDINFKAEPNPSEAILEISDIVES